MARLFLAVAMDPSLAPRLVPVQSKLVDCAGAGALRVSSQRQAHYTLRFLGEQPAARKEAASRAATIAASQSKPFDLAPETLGVFDDERRAHTFWIGAGQGKAELAALADVLESALTTEGFAPEKRAFSAHMTLARTKRRLSPAIVRCILALRFESIGSMRVDEFSLFESRPSPDGAIYVPLETFRLGI
jgi:2'-5' RNA ligase